MSRKELANLSSKKLGIRQEKILFFLAENPNKNAQQIQKGLGYPDSQHGNISTTAKMLERMGLLKMERGKSQKNVSMPLYTCTEEGVFYALARNPNANVLRVLDSYKNQYDSYNSFRNLIAVWVEDFFVEFVRSISEFLPMYRYQLPRRVVSEFA